MDGFDVLNEDGSRFIVAKEKVNEPMDQLPRRAYFEIESIKDGQLGIELKSEEDSLFYDGLEGYVLHSQSKMVYPAIPISIGSVVGVTVWTIEREEGVFRSLITFSVNGKSACHKTISFKGSNVTPVVYVGAKNSEVKNVGQHPFQFDNGKV